MAAAHRIGAMAALALDTHAFVKRLTTAGVPQGQAEIIADEQTRIIQAYNRLIEERLATKQDMTALKQDLEVVKRELSAEIERKLGEVKVDILRRMAGFLLGQTAVLAALIKLL